MGVLSTAALHSNRAAGYPLMNDKDLKATGRDSFDYRIDLNSSLHVVKWYDNKGYSQFNIFYGESQLHQEDMGFPKRQTIVMWHILTWSRKIMKAWVAWI